MGSASKVIFFGAIAFLIVYAIYSLFTRDKGSWSNTYFYDPEFMSSAPHNAAASSNTSDLYSPDSAGEKACRAYLERRFKVPFPKDRPIRNPVFLGQKAGSRAWLELDCYNRDLKIAVEYNGQQHYQFTPFFHPDKDAFKSQQYRDYVKAEECKKAGIQLIVVPYTVKPRDIPDYIERRIRV